MADPPVLPLTTGGLTLETAGGKGMSLSLLAQHGFPVPPGFVITTSAYHAYVATNALGPVIAELVEAPPSSEPAALEGASSAIRSRFADGKLMPDLTGSVLDMYTALGRPPVAVRSSATVEDLPDLSFAGQQETYLNIVEDLALLEAIVCCWSSLWTPRAIGYRLRHSVAQHHLALAVVVQTMVDSEASGVLFTANPLTGKRDEVVIEAVLGLGEGLVSGEVEPDRYVVDSQGTLGERSLGRKELVVRSQEGGGTTRHTGQTVTHQALPDDVIGKLAHLGRQVAESMGSPQDVEWAWADGSLYVLQSRPITSLFPLPADVSPEPLKVMFSFGAVQGILEPMTPMGQHAIQALFAGAGKLFGLHRSAQSQEAIKVAAERLFVDITGLVRHRVWRRILHRFLGIAEPGIWQAMRPLWADPRLAPVEGLGPHTVIQIGPVLVPMLGRLILTLLRPDAQRRRFLHELADLEAAYAARFSAVSRLDERLDLIQEMLDGAFQFLLPRFVPRFGVGMAGLTVLSRLAGDIPHDTQEGDQEGKRPDAWAMMRGMPHNVTTEMDLALWETAQTIQTDPTTMAKFLRTGARDLAGQYQTGVLPEPAQGAIASFLARYGMRGLAEIDLGRPRWREDPTPIMQTLIGYVKLDSRDHSPDAVFDRGADLAAAAIDDLIRALRTESGGRVKARLASWAARRMRSLAGLRESPKFAAVRMMGLARQALIDSGKELVAAGRLEQADDLFYFSLDEMRTLAEGGVRSWQCLAYQRRRTYVLENRRKQIPRLLLSDGTAYYEGGVTSTEPDETTLTGSPVSPGVVEGRVRVILDPHTTPLQPGEILVCPGTDPAWTPLFLIAGGLITEVGGLMTHGSVVAREYGIPAVVGVDRATTRLETGQLVRVDGTTGHVVLL